MVKMGAITVVKAYSPDGDPYAASQKKKDHGY